LPSIEWIHWRQMPDGPPRSASVLRSTIHHQQPDFIGGRADVPQQPLREAAWPENGSARHGTEQQTYATVTRKYFYSALLSKSAPDYAPDRQECPHARCDT